MMIMVIVIVILAVMMLVITEPLVMIMAAVIMSVKDVNNYNPKSYSSIRNVDNDKEMFTAILPVMMLVIITTARIIMRAM